MPGPVHHGPEDTIVSHIAHTKQVLKGSLETAVHQVDVLGILDIDVGALKHPGTQRHSVLDSNMVAAIQVYHMQWTGRFEAHPDHLDIAPPAEIQQCSCVAGIDHYGASPGLGHESNRSALQAVVLW